MKWEKASYASPLAQTCERSLNDIFGSALFFCQPVFQSRSAAYLIFVISLHSHIFCQENFQKGEGGQPFGKNSQKNPLLSGDANIDSGVGAVDATASKKWQKLWI